MTPPSEPTARSAPLQRSRALSSAEIGVVADLELHPEALQRSRALSSAEISAPPHARPPTGHASTEPRSFERGDDGVNGLSPIRVAASTEPRSFERGDSGHPIFSNTCASLQRSRALSSAEIRAWPPALPAQPRFNGAALFRARRYDREPSRVSLFDALQRSRALSSAEMIAPASWSPRASQLQRSRALSSAEMREGDGDVTLGISFNGAALFRARRCIAQVEAGADLEALQRSRALSSAEIR